MPGISRQRKYDDLERDFHKLLRKYDPMYKIEIIKINISSPFMVRTRCVECGGAPNYYFYARKPYLYKEANQQVIGSKWMRGFVKRLTSDWYLDSEPRYFHDIEEFSFTLDDKGYLPNLHRSRGGSKYKEDVIEFVGCDCGQTVWAFNQKSTKNRPEIVNRKGRYTYPNRFEY